MIIKVLNKNYFFIFVISFLFNSNVNCQTDKVQKGDDSLKKKSQSRLFELSLGQSILFINDTKLVEILNETAVVVPTSAKLFFAEFRPAKLMRIPVFFNLPSQTKQFIVNGQIVNERASPTFGTGFQFRVFKLPLGEKGALEFEMGPLASFLLNENNVLRFAPIGAGRLRFVKNEDYVIYFGSSYSLGINVVGVLFGIGYVF